MKKIYFLIVAVFMILPLSVAAQEDLADFEGIYLTKEDLNVQGFYIDTDYLSVIVSPAFFGKTALEDNYFKPLLQLYDESINQGSRVLMEQTDEDLELSFDNEQYISLRFSREVPIAIEIIVHNPKYKIEDEQLSISYLKKNLFNFQLNEDLNLVDQEGNQFILQSEE